MQACPAFVHTQTISRLHVLMKIIFSWMHFHPHPSLNANVTAFDKMTINYNSSENCLNNTILSSRFPGFGTRLEDKERNDRGFVLLWVRSWEWSLFFICMDDSWLLSDPSASSRVLSLKAGFGVGLSFWCRWQWETWKNSDDNWKLKNWKKLKRWSTEPTTGDLCPIQRGHLAYPLCFQTRNYSLHLSLCSFVICVCGYCLFCRFWLNVFIKMMVWWMPSNIIIKIVQATLFCIVVNIRAFKFK